MNLRFTRKLIVAAVMLAAIAGIGVKDAAANSILLTYQGNVFNGTSYTYTYNAYLTGPSDLLVNDYFTIYDFAGLVGTSTQPSNWAFSSTALGPTPSSQSAVQTASDSGSIPNITWTYSGPTVSSSPLAGVLLGAFTANSLYTGTIIDAYVSQDHSNNAATLGLVQGNTGPIPVPLAVAVPEPASMMLFGSALLSLGVAARKRLRRR